MRITTARPAAVYQGPLWYARSDSIPNHFYAVTVDARNGLYVCECPDHQTRFRDCKHIRRVQAGQIPMAITRKERAA